MRNKCEIFRKGKKQAGITLVALVVTIVVLLILTGVSIRLVLDNNGIITRAGKATGDTRIEMNAEQDLVSGQITIDGKTYASIDDYLEGNPLAEHNWTRIGDTFTCSHCNATYEMGQEVDYTAKGKTSTTISAAKSGLDRYYAKNNSYPLGERVDSDGNQTITIQNAYYWVVLGIEDTDGNGIFETLLITRGGYPTENVYFYGAAGYNNAASYIGANGKRVEGEIDRICRELYSNSEYGEARGMTIEDVNSALNYEPIGGEYSEDGGSTFKTTGNLTTKLKDIEIFNSLKTNGTYTPDGTNTKTALGEYELNGYAYGVNDEGTALVNKVNDTTSAITEVERKTIFGLAKDYRYWLASRGVDAYSDSAHFGSGYIRIGSAFSSCIHFASDGYEWRLRRWYSPCSFSKI